MDGWVVEAWPFAAALIRDFRHTCTFPRQVILNYHFCSGHGGSSVRAQANIPLTKEDGIIQTDSSGHGNDSGGLDHHPGEDQKSVRT